jgi:hypothetical protein
VATRQASTNPQLLGVPAGADEVLLTVTWSGASAELMALFDNEHEVALTGPHPKCRIDVRYFPPAAPDHAVAWDLWGQGEMTNIQVQGQVNGAPTQALAKTKGPVSRWRSQGLL